MTTQAATVPSAPAPDDPAEVRPPVSLGRRVQRVLHAQPILGPAMVLAAALVVFSLWNPDRFFASGTFVLILQQTAPIAVLAIGQTIIILTAGIDLSVGAIMVLSMITMAKVNAEQGVPGPLALLIGFLVGVACGLVNGLLVTRLKLPPFIVTLGTFSIFFAINLLYSKSATVRGTDMSSVMLFLGQGVSVAGTKISYGSILMLLLFAVMAYVLRNTPWGRHVYAVGDDVEAARLSGIRVRRVLLSVYVVAGLLCAVAAWVLIGRVGSASPQSGQTENLASITAVVLGGTSLFGGRGLVLGTLLGALVVTTFSVGLGIAGVDQQWQLLATGVLVIGAVTLDQWIRRVKL